MTYSRRLGQRNRSRRQPLKELGEVGPGELPFEWRGKDLVRGLEVTVRDLLVAFRVRN